MRETLARDPGSRDGSIYTLGQQGRRSGGGATGPSEGRGDVRGRPSKDGKSDSKKEKGARSQPNGIGPPAPTPGPQAMEGPKEGSMFLSQVGLGFPPPLPDAARPRR